MISAPPALTHLAQPSKSRCAASSVWPPSMNSNCSGVRQPAGHHGRFAHHRHDVVIQAGRVERVPQRRQGVEKSGGGVDQRRVVVLPPGLVFFGAVVVVDGVDHAVARQRRRAEQHRRLAAVRADLHADAVVEVAQRRVVQRSALVGGHEAGDPLGQCEQSAGGSRGGATEDGRQSSCNGNAGAGCRAWCRCSSVRTRVRSGSSGVDSAPPDRQAGRHRRSAGPSRGRRSEPRRFLRPDDSMVAAEAGVGAATAYTYFSSKEHLVAEVFWRRLAASPVPATDSPIRPCA